jgi:glycosyltransferase involved in cell wall biosynthesis
MNHLSVCLVAQNEQENLQRVLQSVQEIADEIILVDGGSTDRTQEIARENGARVFFRAFTDHADQKNYAASLASHDWIFLLDADEELGEELKESVRKWKEQTPEFAVYEMPRLTWYLGAWIRHSRWYPDWQRRIYRRDKASFSGVIHSALRYEGRVGQLRGDLLHYPVSTSQGFEAKLEKYTNAMAKEMFNQGKRHWRVAMWLATPWNWIHHFVLGAGFLDGYRGVLIAQRTAQGTRLKFIKLGQLVQAAKRAERQAANQDDA